MAASGSKSESELAMDVFSWFLVEYLGDTAMGKCAAAVKSIKTNGSVRCCLRQNVSTSVLIVFVNKVLMDPKMGYKFVFGKGRALPKHNSSALKLGQA